METNLKYVGMAGNLIDVEDFYDEDGLSGLFRRKGKKPKKIKQPKKHDGSGFNKWMGKDGYVNSAVGTAANIALAFANVKSAFDGNKPVIVEDGQGQRKDITNEVKEAYAQNGDAGIQQLMAAMLAQNSNNSGKDEKKEDKTILYVGLGVGGLVLVMGAMAMMNKKK